MRKPEFQVIFEQKTSDAKNKDFSEQDVYDATYAAIMDHRLPPGTKLTESSFSAYFNVSRSVIRNVLFRLSQISIVELRPNRGAIVARPTVEETHNVFEARHIIELAIMKLCIETYNADDLKVLKELVRSEEEAIEEQRYRDVLRLSGEFHMYLAKIANNDVLTSFLVELMSRSSLINALYESHGSCPCVKPDHADLLNVIEERNQEKAIALMKDHLLRIEKRLNLKLLKKNIDLTEVFSE